MIINWTFEDEDGISPLELPATLDFQVECDVFAGEPTWCHTLPEVEVIKFDCISVTTEDETREPHPILKTKLDQWALKQFSHHPYIHEQAIAKAQTVV